MNLSKYFTDKPLKTIMQHHDQLYKLREVASSREEKLKALAKQIDMLNSMNEGGKIKLKLPQDFVSHFLDDQDVDEIWAATHINKGISDKATILGDMRQVWKIFTYLDFVEDEETKQKRKDKENKSTGIVPELVAKKEKKDKAEIENDASGDEEKDDEKAEILESDDEETANPNDVAEEKNKSKGPFMTNSMAQSLALDNTSWNLNNINDMLLHRDFMANVILNSHNRRGRSRGRDGKGGKKGSAGAWSGIGGAANRFSRGLSSFMHGDLDFEFDLNKALMRLGAGGSMDNDRMSDNDNQRSRSLGRLGSKSERKLGKLKKKKRSVNKDPPDPNPPGPNPPGPNPPDPNPPDPKPPLEGKDRMQRRGYIHRILGHLKRPKTQSVYDNLKADGVHDSDYDPDSEVSEHESDDDIIKKMTKKPKKKEKEKEKEKPKKKKKEKEKPKKKKKLPTPSSSEKESSSEQESSSDHNANVQSGGTDGDSESSSEEDAGSSDHNANVQSSSEEDAGSSDHNSNRKRRRRKQSSSEEDDESSSEEESKKKSNAKRKPRKTMLEQLQEGLETVQKRPMKQKSMKQVRKEVREAEKRKKARLKKQREERQRKKEEEERLRLEDEERKRKARSKKKKGSKKKTGTKNKTKNKKSGNNKKNAIIIRKVTIEQEEHDQKHRPIYKKQDDTLHQKVNKTLNTLREHNLSSQDATIIKQLDDKMDILMANYAANLGEFDVKSRNKHRGTVERYLIIAEQVIQEAEEAQTKNDKIRETFKAKDDAYITNIQKFLGALKKKAAHLTKADAKVIDDIETQIVMLQLQYESSKKTYTYFDTKRRDVEYTTLMNLVNNKLKPIIARVKSKTK